MTLYEWIELVTSALLPILAIVLAVWGIPKLKTLAKKYDNETLYKLADIATNYVEATLKDQTSQQKFEAAMDKMKILSSEHGVPLPTDFAKSIIEDLVFKKNTSGQFLHLKNLKKDEVVKSVDENLDDLQKFATQNGIPVNPVALKTILGAMFTTIKTKMVEEQKSDAMKRSAPAPEEKE